jgi:hypothetical protein
MNMEDKLVKIAEYETSFEAELAKSRLEDEGIKAAALGADLVANMHTIQLAMVELQVFEKDVEKAMQILEAVPESLDQETDPQQ